MKRINFFIVLLAVVFTMTVNSVSAQSPKGKAYIAAFEEGRVLNANDISFLNSISSGTGSREAILNGKKYTVGQRLTFSEANSLNLYKSKYKKNNPTAMAKADDAKPIDKSRGTQETCYWYLYCDGNGTCWYIWYCD
jgi:hypothetical protein